MTIIHVEDYFKKIGQRRSMLQYLAKTDITRYRELIQKLGLRK